MRLRATTCSKEMIDGIRRHHSKNFFKGVKKIGSFDKKIQIAVEFQPKEINGETVKSQS